MSLASAARRMLARSGDSATLARDGEGTTITLQARRIGGAVDELGGVTAAQQQFRVKVGTSELAASAWTTKVPKRGDRLTIDGRARAVLDVQPIKERATVAIYELEVAG